MSDRKWYLSIEQAIDEMRDLVRCRCHPAFKERGLHDPDCNCDSAEAVEVLAHFCLKGGSNE